MLHVPDIRKKLVSGALLSKSGFRLVFESDKFVLTRKGIFVGKWYLANGLFKMNVMSVLCDFDINKNKSLAYLIESSNLWHDRLGHVNINTLRKLVSLNLLPLISFDQNHRCEICVDVKLVKTPFHSVEMSSNPLKQSHGDCTRYCYVYLLKSKDETLEAFKQYKNEVENQLNKQIKVVRGECGALFEEFCSDFGIIHQTTAPYSP